MKRVRVIVAAVLLSITGVVARPAEAASYSWRAWQGCGAITQFGNWVPQGGVSYTPYCYGASQGAHGCSGGPKFCYLYWQWNDRGFRTAAVPG